MKIYNTKAIYIGENLEDFCEDEDNVHLTEISDEMNRLPMNVRCFVGAKLKGVTEADIRISSN